jgi:hypothetical protein
MGEIFRIIQTQLAITKEARKLEKERQKIEALKHAAEHLEIRMENEIVATGGREITVYDWQRIEAVQEKVQEDLSTSNAKRTLIELKRRRLAERQEAFYHETSTGWKKLVRSLL